MIGESKQVRKNIKSMVIKSVKKGSKKYKPNSKH